MPMVLVPLEGGRPIPLDKAIVFFGRSPDCDVVLTSSRKVSRKHCCVAQIDDAFVVRDLGSMNGVRVNDQQVKKESRIEVGDELWVGDLGYRLQPQEQSARPSRPKGAGAGAGKLKPPPPPPVDPALLSQDMPVILPEEGEDFSVEETGRRIPVADDIFELDDDD